SCCRTALARVSAYADAGLSGRDPMDSGGRSRRLFDIVAPSLVLCVNRPSDPFLRAAIVRPLTTGAPTAMSAPSIAAAPRTHYGAIAIVGALFFIFGFVTWL